MDTLEDFLKKRGIKNNVIERLKEDKIDCDVINVMTDNELSEYIESFGDRIAIVAYAKGFAKRTSSEESLVPNQVSFAAGVARKGTKRKLIGNINASRKNRRIDVGWFHAAEGQGYKQVRSNNGGGTREFTLDKNWTMTMVKDAAIEHFFPDGKSKLGPKDNFQIELRDFKGEPLEENSTIEDVREKVKLRTLKVYIYSSKMLTDSIEKSEESTEGTHISAECSQISVSAGSAHMLAARTQEVGETVRQPSHSPELPDITEYLDFIDADTPTVQFNRNRHRLSLNRSSGTMEPSTSSNTPVSQCSYETFTVSDSEDEELQRAISDSFTDASVNMKPETPNSMEDILKNFKERTINSDERTTLVVFRQKVLESAFVGMARHSFKLNANVYIKFSGEMGQDYGGPRREFFRLALHELHTCPLFEGKEGEKVFSHNIDLLEKGQYRLAGRLVGLSLSQEGPGLHFLNEALYELMTDTWTGIKEAAVHGIQEEQKEMLEELQLIESDTLLDRFLSKHGDWLAEHGIPNVWKLTVANRSDFSERLVKHAIYYRSSSEISQFVSGMNDVGQLWDIVKANPGMFKHLFCFQELNLTKENFEAICEIEYSEPGSNRRQAEEETVYCWEVFLQDIEDGCIPVTFKELLAFITGADRIPPCGFPKKIEVNFFQPEENVNRLPYVSTCALELYLPRKMGDHQLFRSTMVRALKESLGFEKI